MANQKVPQLPILTAITDADLLYIVDVSDTTDDPTGSSKQITREELLTNVSYIDFNTTAATTHTEGRVSWNDEIKSLEVDTENPDVQVQVGHEMVVRVNNQTGDILTKGTVVYINGAQGQRPTVTKADYSADTSSASVIGLVAADINDGENGYVVTQGILEGLDTTAYSAGTSLYLFTGGTYSDNKPQAPDHDVRIGKVIVSNATTGSIYVSIQNGYELDELHDVKITSASIDEVLVRSSYNGIPVWVNTKTLSGLTYVEATTISGGTISGGTISGGTISGGTISGGVINITSSPNNNTTESNVLVRNSTTGEIQIRTLDSIFDVKNQVTVGLPGSVGVDFNSIKDAIDSITGASSTNVYVVRVGPGVYNENPITMKSYVAILGESSVSTIINANNPNQPLINAVDNSFISDVLIQGCTGTSVSAIMYSSSTSVASSAIVYVENVRFGSNYTHVTNFPFGGGNTAIQCTNIKYGAQPFTLGFYMTSDGSSTGRFQLRNVTTTAGGVANTSGLTFAKVDQPNCTIIGNLVTVTKAGSAPVSGIGFHVENGGLLRLNGFNIQRFGTGIYVPQVGSAPTIDAVGLNFENCTTDVDIIHSGTTGKVNGTDSFLKTKININAPLYEVNQDPKQIVVAKKGGDFSSIKSAVDYLTNSGNTSSSNRFIITVGPGEFSEGEIDLSNTPYVSIVGSSIQTTLVTPTGSTQHIFNLGQTNELSFLTISGAPSGYAGIYCYDVGDFAQGHKISIFDCDTGIWVESDTQDTKFYGEYIDINGEFTYGVKVTGNNNFLSLANLENYYVFQGGTGNTYGNYATGSGATLNITSSSLEGNGATGSTATLSRDGAFYNISATDVSGWGYGHRVENVGGSSSFEFNAVTYANNIWDISVEQSSASGVFVGISNHEKITTISSDVYWSFLDSGDGELEITRKASVTFADGSHTDFTTLVFEGGPMGLMEGGQITTVSGLTISVAQGFGYLEVTAGEVVRKIDWSATTLTLTSNSDLYVYFNENSVLSSSGSRPNSVNNIILGRVVTNSTTISFIDESPVDAEHMGNRYGDLLRNAIGPIYSTGSIVTENTTPFHLDVTQGEYYYGTNGFMPSGGTNINFTQYYRNGSGGWITSATTEVVIGYDDNSGTLSPLSSSAYTKHTLYVVGDNSYEKYFLVLGQNEYTTLVEAENALLPTPPTFFTDSVTQIANIYIRQGATGVTEVEDIRPVIGFKAGGINASSVHGNLLGLTADDHLQYLRVDGGRAMTGNLDMGTNNIISAGTINGVTIQTHATRHQYGGADPVGTVTPSANAIPFADVNGTLDGWVSTATTATLGKVLLSTSPVSASSPIVIGENDSRFTNSFTGVSYSNNTFTFNKVGGGSLTAIINSVTGWTVNGNLIVTGTTTSTNISGGTISGDTMVITSTPTTDNTNTQLLSRDTSTGLMEIVESTSLPFNYGLANAIMTGNFLT